MSNDGSKLTLRLDESFGFIQIVWICRVALCIALRRVVTRNRMYILDTNTVHQRYTYCDAATFFPISKDALRSDVDGDLPVVPDAISKAHLDCNDLHRHSKIWCETRRVVRVQVRTILKQLHVVISLAHSFL